MKPTFLFDIGNVIITFDFEIAVSKIADRCEPPAVEILPKLQPLTDQFECGAFEVPDFVSRASDAIGFSGSQEDFIAAFEDIFELNQPNADLIQELSEKGHRLCLLSNTNAIHVPFFSEKWPEVFGKFDQAIYSHEIGLMKPDPKIFELTIDLLKLDPASTIYIDDRADNCENGSAAGLQTFCYDFRDHEPLLKFIDGK